MAAQNVIIQSPNQSDVLATENIPPPNALTVEDLTDMQVLGVRKREGAQYIRNLKRVAIEHNENVQTEDFESARSYRTSVEALETFSKIPAVGNVIGLDQAIVQLTALVQQNHMQLTALVQQNHVLAQQKLCNLEIIGAQSFNSSARSPDDTLQPPPYVPEFVVGQQVPELVLPPPSAPRSVSDFVTLQDPHLAEVENYYHVNHQGPPKTRLRRLRRIFGMRF